MRNAFFNNRCFGSIRKRSTWYLHKLCRHCSPDAWDGDFMFTRSKDFPRLTWLPGISVVGVGGTVRYLRHVKKEIRYSKWFDKAMSGTM